MFRAPGPPSHTSGELARGFLKVCQDPQAPLWGPPRLPQGAPRHHGRCQPRPPGPSKDFQEASWDPPRTPRDVLGTMEDSQGTHQGSQGARKWAHSRPLSVQIEERGEADNQAASQAGKPNEMKRAQSARGIPIIYIYIFNMMP